MSKPPAREVERDRQYMRRALALARRGWGQTAPNPMVGAVVVRGGRIVGEGYHARFGGPHAEVVALRMAGAKARGSTVYVTLEPCNHWGKTPPCVDALIRAGVTRVVCATRDPGKKSGGGARRLRRTGIRVEFGLESAAARELNAPFFFAHSGAKRPWVTLKLAISADGAVGRPGKRTKITGASADREVHRMRANSDAIAVGRGTVEADDPRLTVRHGRKPRLAPVRIVFSRDTKLSTRSNLARTARSVPTVVVAERKRPARDLVLFEASVEVLRAKGIMGALQTIAAHGVRALLVEGGPTLAQAFLKARVVDRLVIFQSPRHLGAGAIAAFDDASLIDRFRVLERRRCGSDVMTTFDPASRAT